MMLDEGELFGRSIGFPPRIGADGRVAWSIGAENVRDSIRVILLTEPGERVMLREFGSGLRRFLFQPNIVATHRLMEEAITQSLGRWEPRVELESVRVEPAPDEPDVAIATIAYRLVATQFEDQLRLRLQLSGGA